MLLKRSFNIKFLLAISLLWVLPAQAVFNYRALPSVVELDACKLELHIASNSLTDDEWKDALKNPRVKKANQLFNEISATDSQIASLFNPEYLRAILSDPEMVYFHQQLVTYLRVIAKASASSAISVDTLKDSYRKLLTNHVPENSIEERINQFFNPTAGQDRFITLKRFLGDVSREEVKILTQEALAKYLAETKAQTVKRTFSKEADQTSTNQGPLRTVVALSAKTFKTYQKYFKRINYLIHYHTPNQGTIDLAFLGKHGNYANLESNFSDVVNMPGTLLPHIMFTTAEGQLLAQNFALGKYGNYSLLSEPWQFGWCDKFGYGNGSCTHFAGEWQVGTQSTTHHWGPGKVDDWATTEGVDSPDPVRTTLRPFTLGPEYDDLNINAKKLIMRIFRAPEARTQMAVLFGPAEKDAMTGGEYANPGYVIIRLVGHVSDDFVGPIFLVVEDASVPIDPNFNTQISAH